MDQHRVNAKIIIDRSPHAGAGEIIRRHADDLPADLVVCGYGLRELVLGGASRMMLEQDVYPLLIGQ